MRLRDGAAGSAQFLRTVSYLLVTCRSYQYRLCASRIGLPMATPGAGAPAAALPHEGSPILGVNPSSSMPGDVLVLSAHARVGRYVSMLTATLFLLGFHGSLHACMILGHFSYVMTAALCAAIE